MDGGQKDRSHLRPVHKSDLPGLGISRAINRGFTSRQRDTVEGWSRSHENGLEQARRHRPRTADDDRIAEAKRRNSRLVIALALEEFMRRQNLQNDFDPLT